MIEKIEWVIMGGWVCRAETVSNVASLR